MRNDLRHEKRKVRPKAVKPVEQKQEPEKKKYHVEYDTIFLKDKTGREMRARKVTWSDLAIMHMAGLIAMPVFLSFVETDEHKYYAVFQDMANATESPFVVDIGGYENVAGSYIKTDDIELNNFFTKMAPKPPKKEEKDG